MFREGSQAVDTLTRYSSAETQSSVAGLIGRHYFGAACAACAALSVTALAVAVMPMGPAQPWRRQLVVGLLAFALACVWAFIASGRQRHRTQVAMFVTGLTAMGLVFASAFTFGDGLRSPTLGFMGLVVCLVASMTNMRWGTALAAFCFGCVGVLAWAEMQGITAAPASGTPLGMALSIQCITIGIGLIGGIFVSKVFERCLGAAAERERRFRDLLGIAADWYWEQDAQCRITHVSTKPGRESLIENSRHLGQTPWEIRGMGLSEEAMAAHRADLQAHRPFTDVLTRRLDAEGREHFLSVSGEPRFDSNGQFCGYWGVGRDVTDDVRVRQAMAASESHYRQLFQLIDNSPDCIALTDLSTGRYELVNKSFERLTGYSSEEVVGRTATEIDFWHDKRDFDALVAALRETDSAEDSSAVIRCKSGALVSMRISAARFELDGRDYLVLNGHDVTASEHERMEHDAILQNAAIGIAFIRGGRFHRTNPNFDRMFGWTPGQLVGQPTSVIWPHREDYELMRVQAMPILSRGQSYELERQMLRSDNSLFWCRMRGHALDGQSPRAGTIWIAEDVTERRQVDLTLASARDAAEAANRAKSAFLANTSHEIRTPLDGLLGLARLAMQEDLDEQRRRQYLAQIFDSAHSLSEIISDILDLSKIEAGKIALENVPFGLRETMVAVHDAYQSLAESKGLELVLAIGGGVPITVLGDPVRVRQILTNFITNAIKFTERGRVRIHAETTGDERVRLSVSDTGRGVDAQTQRRLFLPFSQGDDSTTRRFGGTGLGLSICRQLAHLMRGEVGVISTPGKGSTFWAELPLPSADEPDSVHGALDAPLDRLHGAHVLMVEDNPVNMLVAVAMLEQWGAHVTQAADGRMALDAVDLAQRQGRLFDVVLMDVQMPNMSGHEAARELRKRFDRMQLPIIALTAAALVSERDQAIACGMNEFLTKPIDATRLKDTLARCIARQFAL